ncbi:ABC transporter G family member 23-like [Salmo trutta]|uniref:ABC transporter G family member 23-like n=1 Tax=Salmo trutta TaxID=8032 RepID=UPI0011305467|nr:ABC transporter G family member 23-like [Salmo trutta]
MKADQEAPPPSPGLEDLAIRCREVCRSYGKLKVLSNLNLTVPQGHIYGLLGPSGCGKTTLLKCILGTLKISRGHISVLGKPPAFPGHQVPGRMVGYMPQDLALYNEFSISDTLTFFGRIHGLSATDTQTRMDFLVDFLDLPHNSSLVGKLSGGQKRRVSLGAALLQNPQLLILDEPTVGVDPVLRAKIWQHLVEIVKTGKVSVVITTHYIEEARQANVVGLMRNGRMLAEGEPETLMKQNSAATLEKAFLQLCETSDQVGSKHSTYPQGGVLESGQSLESGREESQPILGVGPGPVEELPKYSADWKVRVKHVMPKWRNIAALIIKTTVRMKRMPGSLFFQFLLPVMQISLMCLCIGGDPKGIQVAVVNNETSSSSFSQSLLSFLDNSSVQQVNLSHAEAFAGAYNGEYWAVIGFGKNFTSYLTKRMIQRQVSKEVVDGGSVHVWLDLTNRQIALMLQKKIKDAFEGFVQYKMSSRSYLLSLPVKFEEPIYGSMNSDFTTFVTPGAVLRYRFSPRLNLVSFTETKMIIC